MQFCRRKTEDGLTNAGAISSDFTNKKSACPKSLPTSERTNPSNIFISSEQVTLNRSQGLPILKTTPTKEVMDSLLLTAGRLGPINNNLLKLAQIYKGHISPSAVMEEYDRFGGVLGKASAATAPRFLELVVAVT